MLDIWMTSSPEDRRHEIMLNVCVCIHTYIYMCVCVCVCVCVVLAALSKKILTLHSYLR